jgi:SAM-dependent methyltransferase
VHIPVSAEAEAGLALRTPAIPVDPSVDDRDHPSFLAALPLLRCPEDGTVVTWDEKAQQLFCRAGRHAYPTGERIPRLFAPTQWPPGKCDVTEIVKAFYEETPFPNYDGMDTRDSLRAKTAAGLFGRLLDQQVPLRAKILEIGCGTGQMSNFLGMGRGRTVISCDVCLNSLRLASDFRDRFSIGNTHFVQANLFRPPFAPAGFDLVISNGVLHHTGDCAAAFAAIGPLVKPGGHIMIGLYNHLGRLTTLWRRWLIDRLGGAGDWIGYRARDAGEAARRRAWFMDQYKHPHETRHSMSEVLEWFAAAGFDYTASIPVIGDREPAVDMPLFELQSPGSRLDRLSAEIDMLLSGGSDGGLFVMFGRRRR